MLQMIEKRNEMTERGANRRKVIETNAAVIKKMKEIATNYESLKEKYEKDRKKRIVCEFCLVLSSYRESYLLKS